MKNSRLFALVLTGLATSPWLLASAPHPTVLTAKYHDKFCPVVRVIGTDPVVYADGAEHRITITPIYIADRTADFSPHWVRVLTASVGGTEIKSVPADSDEAGQTSPISAERMGFGTRYFEASLEARGQTLSGGFIVVTMISPKILEPGAKFIRPNLLVHDLPDLPAGETVHVKFTAPASGGVANVQFFIQIFDHQGFEVHTNGLGLARKYYALVDRLKLERAVGIYRKKFAGKDHAAVPFVLIKPDFPENFKPPVNSIMATMKIGATGEVLAVTLDKEYDDVTRKTLHDALEGWMFFPELKAGEPVPTKVKLPLQF